MTSVGSYFCPDDGWEGDEPLCPLCGMQAESLEYTGDDEHDTKVDDFSEDIYQVKDQTGGQNDESHSAL